MDYSVLIVAAGKRAGEGVSYEKAFAAFNNKMSVIKKTISIFLLDQRCKQAVVVTNAADIQKIVLSNESGKIIHVNGGKTRKESMLIGLMAVSEDVVLVHDGVRPWLKQKYIDRLLKRMETESACILATPLKSAAFKTDKGYISSAIDRSHLAVSQTPHAFKTSLLIDCYRKAEALDITALDDAEIVSLVSDHKIAVEEGDLHNVRFVLKADNDA